MFRPGPVFANLVLVDEINRASPKTQSALLECMEEGQVTVDGETRLLPLPFMIIATQNPVEYEGTFPLPEAQLDRFAVRVDASATRRRRTRPQMLLDLAADDPLERVTPVTDEGRHPRRARGRWTGSTPTRSSRRYVVALVAATRRDPRVQLGASPRAGLALLRAAKARAAARGPRLRAARRRARAGHVRAVAPPHPDAGRPRPGNAGRRTSWTDALARCPSRCEPVAGAAGARAVALAAAGVAALVASRGFGTPALAILGVGLVALPVLVTALVWARRGRAGRPPDGLAVALRGRATGWRCAWRCRAGPPGSASTGCWTSPSIPASGAVADAGSVRREGLWRVARRARVRGETTGCRRRVARVADPFGLARRARAGVEGASLLVVPRAPRAGAARPRGEHAGGQGCAGGGWWLGFGELERVRDYQAGDRSPGSTGRQTAKRGRLQTKELRSLRGSGHGGDAAAGRRRVAAGDDFETAVTATAALARHLAERGRAGRPGPHRATCRCG